MIGFEVMLRGSLLEGDPVRVVDDFVTDAVWQLGAQSLADWHRVLDTDIVNATPIYETMLIEDRQAPDLVVDHDQGMPYGPWLEGTDPRNQTTRFPGYHAARRVTALQGRKVERVLRPAVEQLIRRLGG